MSTPAPISTGQANASGAASPTEPSSPAATGKLAKALSSLGLSSKKGDGTKTPIHEIAQTPALENNNPFEKHEIPAEARNQAIVGVQGEQVADENSKVLLAIDGTEAGEKAFQFLLKSQILNRDAHIFIATVLPANVMNSRVSGPLSIDTKRQNELLKELRAQALAKLQPYKDQLKARGYTGITLHTLHGEARQSLIRVAEHHKIDLLIVGKRTKKGIAALTSGATSTYLVQHSTAPVLVIK